MGCYMKPAEKVIQLYKYLQELSILKEPKVTEIRNQKWHCFLKDVPVDSEYVRLFYKEDLGEGIENEDILLSVRKPEFTKCPRPPENIENWLENGWEDFRNEANFKGILDVEKEKEKASEEIDIERFDDLPERRDAFDEWVLIREKWVAIQEEISEVREFFMSLRQLHVTLEIEEDSLELMVGEGLLQDTENSQINHPILLKRITIDFDAKENIIIIKDTEKEPELYTMLFQTINGINNEAIIKASEEIFKMGYHPLDRKHNSDFLKRFVHGLSSNGKFLSNNDEKIGNDDRIIVQSEPVFFLRKAFSGAFGAISKIIDNIENNGYLPGALVDIVDGRKVEIPIEKEEETIEEKLASSGGESVEIFLAKQANREQLRILERIENCNAVLVQGPPGTGKTHTIANIMGHFLTQGKRVLITSQTKKALTVLKDKLPGEIQNLCVSLLDEDKKDMEKSVDGIVDYVSINSSTELKRKFENSKNERIAIMKELSDIRNNIFAIKYQERKNIVFDGKGYSTIEVASFVCENADRLGYIPGKALLYQPLPVPMDELAFVYKSNIEINELEDEELAKSLPNPEELISLGEFRYIIEKEAEDKVILKKIEERLGYKIKFDFERDELLICRNTAQEILAKEPLLINLKELTDYIATLSFLKKDWMIQAIADGKKGGVYKQKWQTLVKAIKDCSAAKAAIVVDLLGKKIDIGEQLDFQLLLTNLERINDLFLNRGIISNIKFHFDKPLKQIISQIKIDGRKIECVEDCLIAKKYIEWQIKRQNLASIWDNLMADHAGDKFSDLDNEAEEFCENTIPKIERALQWYNDEYGILLTKIKNAGFEEKNIFGENDTGLDVAWVSNVIDTSMTNLTVFINVTMIYLRGRDFNKKIKNSLEILENATRIESNICQELCSSLLKRDACLYNERLAELTRLYSKYSSLIKRNIIIEKISAVGPGWAEAIKTRQDIHGKGMLPENIKEAWKWKQFEGIIEEISAKPFKKYQKEAVLLSNKLREKTEEAAKWGAWYHLVLQYETNLSMRSALQRWKQTVKRISKTGNGKNDYLYHKQARALMTKCQDSVPAWIMPINKVFENFDAQKNSFDVVIIDEASQADLTSMALLYMAKKVIVVGDDKQVNPMAVGTNVDDARILAERFLKQIFPLSWQLFDLKASLYDIVGQTFQAQPLHEHFRCVPDIIGYSNKLSYNFAIKPLRSSGDSSLRPAIVSFRVKDGQRSGRRKINNKEAEAIVALLLACIEQKEYSGMTFGIISLLGSEQAELIQRLIFEKVGPEIIEERKILCGDASHFQGDERDVIFLSVVDSNEGDGILRKVGEGADESTKKRYNVAASRARNQMFIIHSLDYKNALKSDDIRRDLLEYAENPKAYSIRAEEVAASAESPFEEAVGKALFANGYHIKQQWEVGAYRIDMIAICNKKSIAIECDGDRFHSGEEKIMQDMERQTILERLGWRFIRIRGSEYYRSPEETLKRVMDELNDYGILPEAIYEKEPGSESNELLDTVKIRAAQLINSWQIKQVEQNDSSPSIFNSSNHHNESVKIVSDKKNKHCFRQNSKSSDDQSLFDFFDSKNEQIKESKHSQYNKLNKVDKVVPNPEPKEKKINNDLKTKDKIIIEDKSIIDFFQTRGINFIDNHKKTGIIWVPCSKGMERNECIEEIRKKFGFVCSFEERGSTSTQNTPAWRIMIK